MMRRKAEPQDAVCEFYNSSLHGEQSGKKNYQKKEGMSPHSLMTSERIRPLSSQPGWGEGGPDTVTELTAESTTTPSRSCLNHLGQFNLPFRMMQPASAMLLLLLLQKLVSHLTPAP